METTQGDTLVDMASTQELIEDEEYLVPDLRGSMNDSTQHSEGEQRKEQWVNFGKYLLKRRSALALTQKDAAAAAGLKTNTWWRLENGLNGPQPETITKLATALQEDDYKLFKEAGFKISQQAIEDSVENMQIGARIRIWRRYRNMAPQVVASKLGLSLNEFLLYESGNKQISAVLLKHLAGVIQVPTNDLLHDAPLMPPSIDEALDTSVTKAELIRWQKECLEEIRDEIRALRYQPTGQTATNPNLAPNKKPNGGRPQSRKIAKEMN